MKKQEMEEIYSLAGPLLDLHKDKCLRFHISRIKKYVNKGGRHKHNRTKNTILKKLQEVGSAKSTELQFDAGVGVDVVLKHLNKLYKEKVIHKERRGKYYLWSFENASECKPRISVSRREIS